MLVAMFAQHVYGCNKFRCMFQQGERTNTHTFSTHVATALDSICEKLTAP